MGAIAEAFEAFARPLFDQTDGSVEQLNKALAIGQLCYNLALMPDDRRSSFLAEIRKDLPMDDAEFEDFQRSIIIPMILRHQAMFPFMHQRVSDAPAQSVAPLPMHPKNEAPGEKYPGTDRYAPCPCNSGEKYKFCCGAKRR